MKMSKRKFIKIIAKTPLLVAPILMAPAFVIGGCSSKSSLLKSLTKNTLGEKQMSLKNSFELPALPYNKNALEPHISENTLNYHYGKHHQTYITNLNNLVAGTDLAEKSLEDIIKISSQDKSKVGIFNNAAQVWNHTFYWHSMKPNGGGKPTGELFKKLEADFGSFENFITEFKNAGTTQFGSGWAWLVLDNGKLKIVKTSNAETPLTTNAKPLMTMDVWEHAYYLDFQNARANYIDAFLKHLINWDFVANNLK